MKIFGGILMAVGILIAATSGLCSLVYLFDAYAQGMLVAILLFGGIPFALGVGLIFGGRACIRAANKGGETE